MGMNAHKLNQLENVMILEHINNYFKELSRNNRDYTDIHDNSKTQMAYEADVRLFLREVRGKERGSELEYLSLDELQFTIEDLDEFKEKLFDKKNDEGKNLYTNKTVNRKISAVKSFSRYLARKKVIKDVAFLELVTSEKERDNHYGALEVSEVFEMAELAWKNEREKGEIKRLMILFALDTCIRKSALLKLKWSDFSEREDGIMVKGIDKGNNEFRQLISKELYEELLKIKGESEKVFDLSNDAILDMMKRLRKTMNIPDDRKVVFHSIRKAGVTYRYRVTGDILEAKRAARHKNINTTQIYLSEEDYGALGAVSSAGKINDNLYKEVDLETLQLAISMCKKDVQLILNMKLMEVLKRK